MLPTLAHENYYWKQGMRVVVGVDEVGRGSLAGPVVAAAVSFDPGHTPIKGMDDSKRVSPLNRQKLSQLVYVHAHKVCLSTVSVADINTYGISAATHQAINECLYAFIHIDSALIDGIWKPDTPYITQAIVRGDQQCYSIAAASIVAKVYRDQLMCTLHASFPEYEWNQNKGYGTSRHRSLLKKFGPSPHHRTLFIRKSLAPSSFE